MAHRQKRNRFFSPPRWSVFQTPELDSVSQSLTSNRQYEMESTFCLPQQEDATVCTAADATFCTVADATFCTDAEDRGSNAVATLHSKNRIVKTSAAGESSCLSITAGAGCKKYFPSPPVDDVDDGDDLASVTGECKPICQPMAADLTFELSSHEDGRARLPRASERRSSRIKPKENVPPPMMSQHSQSTISIATSQGRKAVEKFQLDSLCSSHMMEPVSPGLSANCFTPAACSSPNRQYEMESTFCLPQKEDATVCTVADATFCTDAEDRGSNAVATLLSKIRIVETSTAGKSSCQKITAGAVCKKYFPSPPDEDDALASVTGECKPKCQLVAADLTFQLSSHKDGRARLPRASVRRSSRIKHKENVPPPMSTQHSQSTISEQSTISIATSQGKKAVEKFQLDSSCSSHMMKAVSPGLSANCFTPAACSSSNKKLVSKIPVAVFRKKTPACSKESKAIMLSEQPEVKRVIPFQFTAIPVKMPAKQTVPAAGFASHRAKAAAERRKTARCIALKAAAREDRYRTAGRRQKLYHELVRTNRTHELMLRRKMM